MVRRAGTSGSGLSARTLASSHIDIAPIDIAEGDAGMVAGWGGSVVNVGLPARQFLPRFDFELIP